MAYFRLEMKVHSRTGGARAVRASAYGSGGRMPVSAVRMAAYRSGQQLYDEHNGRVWDFTSKQPEIWHSEILAPANAPEWASDRLALWNEVERVEKRCDAQLFRELVITLPRQLSREQGIELLQHYVRDQFVSKGMVADLNIHCPDAADGEPQPHAHVMLTMRPITKAGFGNKERSWNERAFLQDARKQWEAYGNAFLANAGSTARIDHRRLRAQGIERVPQRPRGVSPAWAKGAHHERMTRYEWAYWKRRTLAATHDMTGRSGAALMRLVANVQAPAPHLVQAPMWPRHPYPGDYGHER